MCPAAAVVDRPQLPDLESWRRSRGDLAEPDFSYWRRERVKVLTQALSSPLEEQKFRDRCAADILYWVTYTAWTKEPRRPPGKQVIPLIPWGFQAKILVYLAQLILHAANDPYFKANVVLEKARDMAGTVTVLLVAEWLWQFHGMSFVIGSKDKDSVDTINNLDTPFEKIRFNLERQPHCLLPKGFDMGDAEQYKKRHIGNSNVGQITGEAPSATFSRKSRAICAIFDEFAFWDKDPDASWSSAFETVRVRIAISTPNGPNNLFANLVSGDAGEEVDLFTLYWWLHPYKSRGLEFVGGKPTSEWYRVQLRTGSAQTVAREIDLNYESSIKGELFEVYKGQHRVNGLKPEPGTIIWRCWDPGNWRGVVWAQLDRYNRILFLKELAAENMELGAFADAVLAISSQKFPGFKFMDIGDPAGTYVSSEKKDHQNAEYNRLRRDKQIFVESAFISQIPTQIRTDISLELLIDKMVEQNRITATPGLLIDPKECRLLDRGFSGKVRRVVTKDGTVLDEIEKPPPYGEVVDCARYLAIKFFYRRGNSKGSIKIKKEPKKWTRSRKHA